MAISLLGPHARTELMNDMHAILIEKKKKRNEIDVIIEGKKKKKLLVSLQYDHNLHHLLKED